MQERKQPYALWYRLRGLFVAPLLLVMLLCTWAEVEFDAIIFPVGLAVFCTGVVLRVWAQTHLGYRLKKRGRKRLSTTGPYAYVRNPFYMANTAILSGLAVMSELVWFVPIVVLWCAVVYGFVVRYEEGHLLRKYGQPYHDYKSRVPRWIPAGLRSLRFAPPDYAVLVPSLMAESHNLALLVLPLLKEFLDVVRR